jgi:transposase
VDDQHDEDGGVDRVEYAIFCGLDVGKGTHHAVALDPGGRRVFDRELPQDETRLRALFTDLLTRGNMLVVVDQPATIGALPIAVARAVGADVAYLPGLAMRRIADLHPGQAKTDARDAFIIADAARTMPHTLRRVDVGEEALAELTVLIGFDDDQAAEATRLTNRIRGLLTQIHPALERVLGPKAQTTAVLELLSRFGGPAGLKAAGRRQVTAVARKNAPRAGEARRRPVGRPGPADRGRAGHQGRRGGAAAAGRQPRRRPGPAPADRGRGGGDP